MGAGICLFQVLGLHALGLGFMTTTTIEKWEWD